MRPFLGLLGVVFLASIGACIGDDPASPAGPSDAGADGAVAVDPLPDTDKDAASAPDAQEAGPPDAAPDAGPTFDVATMPGLKLWLESTRQLVPESAGSTGFGSWTDSAPGAPDHIAVPTTGKTAPSIEANGIAGRASVSFIAGNGFLSIANHDDFKLGTGDFLMAAVAKIVTGNGPFWLLHPQQSAGSQQAFAADHFCFLFGVRGGGGCTTPNATLPTGGHLFVTRRAADEFELRIDGAALSFADTAASPVNINVTNAESAFIGGSFPAGGAQSTMLLSELVMVVGPTADPQLAALEAHLKSKYAIP